MQHIGMLINWKCHSDPAKRERNLLRGYWPKRLQEPIPHPLRYATGFGMTLMG